MNRQRTDREPPARHPGRRAFLLLLSGALLLGAGGIAGRAGLVGSAAAEAVVVVVNAANPAAELSADEVSKMFLKKTTRWPGKDEKVLPVDLVDSSALRESFSKQIHGKGTAAIKAYWQKMIFSGHDVPPPEKPTIGEALSYVRGNPGAIGYAPAGADLGPGIKVLKVTP